MKLIDPPLFRANPKRQEAQQFVASEPKLLSRSSSNLVKKLFRSSFAETRSNLFFQT
jgi:hypothetical protein